MSPFLFAVLEVEPRTLQTPGKHSTTELYDPKIEHLDYQTLKPEVGLGSCDEGY